MIGHMKTRPWYSVEISSDVTHSIIINVLFRTRNLGQHFFDIPKKNDVNQSLISLINENLKIILKFFVVTSKKQGNGIIESKVGLYSIKASSHIFVS
jgi:hypothetical protein